VIADGGQKTRTEMRPTRQSPESTTARRSNATN
jgi:hypothetical protein